MTFETIIIIAGFFGLLLIGFGLRRLRRGRFVSGGLQGFSGAVLVALAALIFSLLGNFYVYHRLTAEQPLAELRFHAMGAQYFQAIIRYPSGQQRVFDVRGDDWQLDARILKWRGYATLIGFDTAYRLDRLSGRYRAVEQERTDTRTVYALSEQPKLDLWTLAKRYNEWLPWVDTLYGSAAYLPMADNAVYTVSVTQSGLVARPFNEPARNAVEQWR